MTERLKERIAEEWAMLDPVDPLRGLLSDVIDVLAQPAQEPVAIHQHRIPYCADWYDGIPDHHDGHGPYEVRTLYTAPQQQEPRNFCSRCGKRTADLTVIHTCTPPEGGHQ